MTELLIAEQMRAIENAAINSGEVTGRELMERAGQGVVDVIFKEWPKLAQTSHEAIVLCGPGNNGGDGFVVARLLHGRGWKLRVLLFGSPEKLPPDAAVNCAKWLKLGEIISLNEQSFRALPAVDLYVDAVFGTGLSRRVNGELANLFRHLGGVNGDDFKGNTIAIDAPSGLCLDSGRVLADGIVDPLVAPIPRAEVTVTFDSPKIGHFLAQGPMVCGNIQVVDIGLRKWRESTSHNKRPNAVMRPPTTCLITESPMVRDRRYFSRPSRVLHRASGHKFDHGHAFILSGPATKTGAARLAARGALRIGAGLVTIGSPSDALAEHAAQLNAVMLMEIGDGTMLRNTLKDERISSLCLGPGMTLGEATRQIVETALKSQKKVVLDASALTVFRENPQELFDMLHSNVVLTPHGGEFQRLFPDLAEELAQPPFKGPAFSKVDATRAAANRAGCVVLFKGATTVIATPQGQVSLNAAHYKRSTPWLATAGSGDVLSGFIAGLLARGFPPQFAAEAAAWLHVEAAHSFGAGLISEDLPEQLVHVFRMLS